MATKRPAGLGRGLDVLLGSMDNHQNYTTASKDPVPKDPTFLPLTQLTAGQYQPRKTMDESNLCDLAKSIKNQGVMQPLLVRPLLGSINGTLQNTGAIIYEIIAGERRFRAAHLAKLVEVPVLVCHVSNETAALMALIENMQREDLNPLEEAQGIQRLVVEFKYTHEQAAEAVGRSRSGVSNLLRLLNLVPAVQLLLAEGDFDMGHARCLLPLTPALQLTAAHQIRAQKMSVRDAEALVKRLQVLQENNPSAMGSSDHAAGFLNAGAVNQTSKKAVNKSAKFPMPTATELRQIETELSDAWTSEVTIDIQSNQSGKLCIAFGSLDALNGVIERLRQLKSFG